ncbi:MAG: DNA alkylation repair protein [Hyphomicrobiales bacterium]|nr:DNA alkylation repair protein [Hyphomicrobiales bacterium]
MARIHHTLDQALEKLRQLAKAENLAGMSRFGIETDNALGVSMPNIRNVGKEITKNHELAQNLWDSGIHEARILASIVDDHKWVTRQQMDEWALDFYSWDLCDQVCGNLFDKSIHADEKIRAWADLREEFVKRAAFALIAWRAVHDKQEKDEVFLAYFPLIEKASDDPRNFVKKAVNWALRQIGKRSQELHAPALAVAKKLASSDNSTRRWIGKDAAKELDSAKLRKRLNL